VAILVAASLGLPTLWVTWAAYRGPRRARAGGPTLGQVADQLAIAIGAQWEAEAAVRRLNDPYPLPVSWGPAEASLTDSWESLVKLATGGGGWPVPPPPGTWAVGPEDLAGKGGELVEVLARVPTGRLVVLGEPGAGKTMLMVRLVLDLLVRRPAGGPVPLLASVASWSPADQDLRGWLADQLVTDHPALATLPPGDSTKSTQAAALMAAGLIVPVLDGLDEIPAQVRGSAISRINDALRPGEQVVVTCRTKEYRDAIRPESGVEVTLRAAAAVQLHPLDADTVRSYLSDDAAGPVTRARWAPVLAVLGTEAPAGEALTTPLMVGLARAIYDPRPGELTEGLCDPAELCSPDLTDRAAAESLLFDAFIPAAYRHNLAGRWKAQDAERWLVFLARHLERTIGGSDLAWWQLSLGSPGFVLAAVVAVGVVLGAVNGVTFGIRFQVVAGVVAGIATWVVVSALIAMAAVLRESIKPVRGIRLRPPRRRNIVVGVAAGVAAGVALGAGVGAGVAVAVGFVDWVTDLESAPFDLGSVTNPQIVLAGDRRTGVALGFAWGSLLGVVAGIAAGIAAGVTTGIVVGAAVGAVFGSVSNFTFSAWPTYLMARIGLVLRRRLPWQFMGFLADAHRRGVLRQVGAVYQFRHVELQHRLANRNADKRKPTHQLHPPQ
jgi:hypothetical protein